MVIESVLDVVSVDTVIKCYCYLKILCEITQNRTYFRETFERLPPSPAFARARG